MCGIFAYQGTSIGPTALMAAFQTLATRGPDDSRLKVVAPGVSLGFHRLAIMDPSPAGNQPFQDPLSGLAVICNGEIFNEPMLRARYKQRYDFRSRSDCEILLPLLLLEGLAATVRQLDAEFAFVAYDPARNKLLAARDPIGIRPLFYGTTAISGEILFASEAKALHPLCENVKPFPPGHYFDGENFHLYRSMTSQTCVSYPREEAIRPVLQASLTAAVSKRLHSDRPLGCLLSGGLDSSLIAALATRLTGRPLTTFAIGCDVDPIDLRYAAEVARYIGSQHHEVRFSHDDAIASLEPLIYQLETWDITTIRASVGMSLLCRYIRKNTDIKVLLTGEVADELFGYKYTDFAPNAAAFQAEAQKRVRELHVYDVLRADRCIAGHGLEARVPFGDLNFVDTVMSIDPEYKLNTKGMGKYLLRSAFAEQGLLPDTILYREKAAFSDAVGHSVVDVIKQYAASVVSDKDFSEASRLFPYRTPVSKEAYLYRQIFERHFPGRADWIPDYWMPNPEWEGCRVDDPSARVLQNYGKSGS